MAVLVIIIFDSFQIFLRMWKDECTKDKFKCEYENPVDFALCFWQKTTRVSKIWIMYRFFIVLAFSACLFVIVIIRAREDSPWYKNPIFYYYWVDFTELWAFVLGLLISVQMYLKQKKDPPLPPPDKMPWHYKFMWGSYVIGASSATVVTIIFCLFIYSEGSYPYFKYSVVTHICNTVFVLIDFSVCAVPFRVLHIYLPVTFACCYGLFTFIYQNCGGTGNQGKIPIYKILDWREPVTALKTCTVHLVCAAVMHFAFCVIHLGKMWVKKRGELEIA